MKNYVQPGEVIELTAPTGGVLSGAGIKILNIVAIATVNAALGEKFSAFVGPGVVEVGKVSAQAWAVGDLIYFDESTGLFTTAATTGNHLVGYAVAIAANPTATGKVRLDGVARADTA